MLAAALDRFPLFRDLRVQFAALACVTALPFVAGAAYDIWFALQTTSGVIASHARSDVIEVRVGGLAIALMVSGLLAALMLHRMMPARDPAAAGEAPENPRAINRLLERRVEFRTRALERSMRELESYSYLVSHNLRAPLRAIDACATLIETHHAAGLYQEGVALVVRLRSSAQRMGAMMDGLIEYARLGSRRLVLQKVDMTDVARVALEDMRLSAEQLERVSIGSLPSVPADAGLLAQVWRHLIDNALKFSARSGDRAVRIEGAVRHGVAEFRISDSGIGFEPAQEAKLFNLFERLHRETEFPGLGIGLAIVKRIVERHGGIVWAEGTPGKGASFGFALPLGAPGEAPPLRVRH